MSFLAPAFLGLFALSIPIVLLFFLRRRRDPVEVSTTFLFEEALREERVSLLLHRLERNLLLVLQIAALFLLAAAAADLVFRLPPTAGARRVVLLVDRSASMGTRDGAGRRRIDRARERAGVLLESLRGGDEAMLVAFDSEARVLSGLTGDFAALRVALAGIEPADRPTNARAGLAAAAAGAADAEVFLFSDGAFPEVGEVPDSPLPPALRFVATGGDSANAGVTSLEVAVGLDLPPRCFVGLFNAGAAPAARTLSLLRGEAVFAAQEVSLPPGAGSGVSFDLSAVPPGPCEVRLEPADALPADDRAFFILREEPVRRILVVTPGNPLLERLRDLHPRVEVYVSAPDAFDAKAAATFDLLIIDREPPADPLPARPALWIDAVPPGRGVTLAPPLANPEVIDFDRARPANRDVDWSDVLFARASPILAERPGLLVPLVESAAGPLVAELTADPHAVVLGFDLSDSNLVLRVAWPILLANLLDQATFRDSPAGASFARAGSVLSAPLPPEAARATLFGPGGVSFPLAPLSDRTVAFAEAGRAGFYRFEFDRGPPHAAAVSLLSPEETAAAPADHVFVAGERRPADPGSVEANRPARPWLLLLALVALAAEFLLHTFRRRR
jgi:hypothetical protein